MKPVPQTIFGDKVGNCYAACIASLLEVPLDDVPNFCALPGDDWPQVRDAWFAERGLFTVNVIIGGPAYMGIMYQTLNGVPCILCGDSPRGPFKHCVVGEYVRQGHTFRVPENSILKQAVAQTEGVLKRAGANIDTGPEHQTHHLMPNRPILKKREAAHRKIKRHPTDEAVQVALAPRRPPMPAPSAPASPAAASQSPSGGQSAPTSGSGSAAGSSLGSGTAGP